MDKSSDLTFCVDCVILDVEGTTTSIKFVKDELFPFAASHVKRHLQDNWQIRETRDDANAVLRQAEEDSGENLADVGNDNQDCVIDRVVKLVQDMIAQDRKVPCLKNLQGKIWKKGYEDGRLKGHVYADVPTCLKQWREDVGVQVYIYSSGSVAAQKLLFAHTEYGDLTQFLNGHFDTAVGPKTASESYVKIATSLATPADKILFLTDIVAEARAALAAGMRVVLASRPGNAPVELSDGEHFPTVSSFADIVLVKSRE
ncbi:enolase-phosphatase E1 isoform X2 [Hyalella azteca]|uniref:Enolase-phosphatase E1 isoform X1 n=1 Tax=Hyalella azteca TaxID=294128 RepID=A0A8B7N3G6_HYAAZ|nr:enolase-phosphatase E1 isoform X1 [Hyalella azteca]XP_047737429.1 enolase-phosphatase E1 isoform X2 [Hyalella azteca]